MKKGEEKKCTGVNTLSSYVMVWIAMAALGGSLAFHFSTAVFSTKARMFSARYMIDVKTTLEGFSALMCDSLYVRTGTFQAYRLEEAPKSAPEKYKFNFTLSTSDILPDIQSFYLAVGSEVIVTICIDKAAGENKTVETLIFKGDTAYNVWKGDNSVINGAYRQSTISMPCNSSSIFHVNPKEADNYYFVIYNSPYDRSFSQHVNYRVTYDVHFLQYDLSAAKLMCDYNIHRCDVPLDLNTDQNVVLRFGNDSARDAVTSSCTLRPSMWAVMFGVLPGILGLLLTGPCLVMKCYCKVLDRREKRNGVV